MLRTAAWLHGADKVPCMSFVGPPFPFPANSSRLLDAVFDQADSNCTLPFETTDLAVNVEGSVGANGRQEFGIRYRFTQESETRTSGIGRTDAGAGLKTGYAVGGGMPGG